jgi:hypothetical protein
VKCIVGRRFSWTHEKHAHVKASSGGDAGR